MKQLPDKLPANPLALAAKWLGEASEDGTLPNADAMTLATVDETGNPSARIVLCKAIVPDPGYLLFYTNYESAKGNDLDNSGRVACVFHWDHLNRQVRVEGIARRSPPQESDQYFATREKESQVGAWTSSQSQPIASRQALLAKHARTLRKLAGLAEASGKREIPRPPFWGGYRIWVSAVELWVRGQARLHDRARWERSLEEPQPGQFLAGDWSARRLQP